MRLSVIRFAFLATAVVLAGHPVRAQRPASQPSIAASVFSSKYSARFLSSSDDDVPLGFSDAFVCDL